MPEWEYRGIVPDNPTPPPVPESPLQIAVWDGLIRAIRDVMLYQTGGEIFGNPDCWSMTKKNGKKRRPTVTEANEASFTAVAVQIVRALQPEVVEAGDEILFRLRGLAAEGDEGRLIKHPESPSA